jgi:hypothetical protein
MTVRSSAESRAALSLHVKDVAQLNWGKADELVSRWCPELLGVWQQLTSLWRSPAYWETNAAAFVIQESADIDIDDLEKLEHAGFLEEIPLTLVRGTCNSFTVDEQKESGDRRRWILHPKIANDIFPVEGHGVPFPTMQELEQGVLEDHGVAIDYRWFFGQFSIDATVALYNCVVHGGRAFRPTTIPTGSSGAPLLAQILTIAVARAACGATRVTNNCFIDNTRFCGVESELTQVVDAAFSITADIGISINENREICTARKTYVFLGIYFDHADCSVALSEKTKRKLALCVEKIRSAAGDLEQGSGWSFESAQSVFGVTTWASSVVGCSKADHYHVYKYMRRRARVFSEQPLASMSIWPCIKSPWLRWLDKLTSAPPRKITSAADDGHEITMYTDASDSGWGAVVWSGNEESITADRWRWYQKRHHINLKELNAVRLAITNLMPKLRNTRIHLHIDNTSAQGQLKKMRSNIFQYNTVLRKLEHLLKANNITILSTSYIASASNPADFWSRIHTT